MNDRVLANSRAAQNAGCDPTVSEIAVLHDFAVSAKADAHDAGSVDNADTAVALSSAELNANLRDSRIV